MGQQALPLALAFAPAEYAYGLRSSGETHGVVLTRRHIVELMLDLADYTPDRDLAALRLLEPACGHGVFLQVAIERLLLSAERHGRHPGELDDAVAGLDIDPRSVTRARSLGFATLLSAGLSTSDAERLSTSWIRQGDGLLQPFAQGFDVVIGNPPYVRIEQLSPRLQAEYRARFSTLFDRADLYVAFIERGLQLLTPTGVLSLICADRWILNRYGGPLRALIAKQWGLRSYVDLHRTSPFESEVAAYPAIFCIGPKSPAPVLTARLDTATPEECRAVAGAWQGQPVASAGVDIQRHSTWFTGDSPWVLNSPAHLRALRDLEARFQPIEADGQSRIGIGVASGCDRAFIVEDGSGIEQDRLLPLVMRKDIQAGHVDWGGRFILNVFQDDGALVPLEQSPGLAAHLHRWESEIRGRHVARKNAPRWYRTIDRVFPALLGQPKLPIPDIAGATEVAFDPGHFYPHHNLYFVTSPRWDLEVLGGLLSSRVALFFVWSYAVKMRGGYLRFQAQYLRRIRVPAPEGLGSGLSAQLKAAFRARDFVALDRLALEAYSLPELPPFDFVDTRS